MVAEYVEALGGRPESTVFGFGFKGAGALGSLRQWQPRTHARLRRRRAPAAMSASRPCPSPSPSPRSSGGVSGRDLITAIAAGTDLHTRLDLAVRLPDWTMTEGWFATQLFGFLSGAVTAGRLRGFDAERIENALGIAFTQVSGSRQMAVGASTDLRSMQAGFSGQGAVLAAELAARGIVGSKEIIEGRYGIYKTYVRNQPDWSALTEGLGTRFPAARRARVQGVAGLRLYPGDQYRDPEIASGKPAEARKTWRRSP